MSRRKSLKTNDSIKDTKMNDEDWKRELEALSINDGDWWCMVTLMVETITDHSRCVSLFNSGAEEGKRRAIYSLSYEKTLARMKMVAKQKADKSTPAQGVCRYANKLLEESNPLPTPLLAGVIKYLVHCAKVDNISFDKKQADYKREIDEEYAIMQTVFDTRFRSKKGEEVNGKALTKLRKRGEDWKDVIYVDDAPVNGPNLYVILTGFHDPELPAELISIGLPLTCILRIRRSNEQLEHIEIDIPGDTSNKKAHGFFQEYTCDGIQLFKYWTLMEKYLKDPETYPAFSDVAFFNFSPPELAEILDDDEYENMKIDMYNRVSFIVYDFYDLYRQYSTYLRAMKINKSIGAESVLETDTSVYRSIVDCISQDRHSVPVLLFAILLQVESNDCMSLVDFSLREEPGTISMDKISIMSKDESETKIGISLVQEKVKQLNIKYEIGYESKANKKESEVSLNPELMLEGDNLDPRKMNIPCASDFVTNILRILYDPRIFDLWQRHKKPSETTKMAYSHHFNEIRRYFNNELNQEEYRHYLHLLMFNKIIKNPKKQVINKVINNEEKSRIKTDSSTNKPFEVEREVPSRSSNSSWTSKEAFKKRRKSFPILSAQNKHKNENRTKSETKFDPSKLMPGFPKCSALFDLIDFRELLVAHFPKKNRINEKRAEEVDLEDFEDAELLSRKVFQQVIYECFFSFDRFEATYFEPTDSILLYFTKEYNPDEIVEKETVSSIRTPIGFREFCEYIVEEERDWITRIEGEHEERTKRMLERLMRKSSAPYEETVTFNEELFILPRSLKARYSERARDFIGQNEASEPNFTAFTSKRDKKDAETTGKNNRRRKLTSAETLSRNGRRDANETDSSSLSMKHILSFHVAEEGEPYEFIGYDLGRIRVQVTEGRKTFLSNDGTLVRVEIDEWLYKKTDLRIAVTTRAVTLRFCREWDTREINEIFHLETESGVLLAFGKPLLYQSYQDDWRYSKFDFRASLPSGLLIKPITGDGPENPFYIRQSCTSKRRSNGTEVAEISRKFLRNGTVLKYMEDGAIIVLRPNSVIVNCTDFKNFKDDDEYSAEETASKKNNAPKKESKSALRNRTKRNGAPSAQSAEIVGQIPGSRISTMDQVTSEETVSSTESSSSVKVSRYTVVNHDGRSYEVQDDVIVREHHRLLVRTAWDHEVKEMFTRRADGTDSLLKPNGDLTVTFPDGTRITTGYSVEVEEIRCDWSAEEIRRYFARADAEDTSSSSNSEYQEELLGGWNDEYVNETMALSIQQGGFVSVLLTCRMEHKNYATVLYDQSAVNCTLSMPDDLRVSISRGGHYEVSMAKPVNLKIQEESLKFVTNKCVTCGSESTSTYEFTSSLEKTPSVIFSHADMFGNVFEVKHDGTTSYRRNDDGRHRKLNQKEDLFEKYIDREEEKCDEVKRKRDAKSPNMETDVVEEEAKDEDEDEDKDKDADEDEDEDEDGDKDEDKVAGKYKHKGADKDKDKVADKDKDQDADADKDKDKVADKDKHQDADADQDKYKDENKDKDKSKDKDKDKDKYGDKDKDKDKDKYGDKDKDKDKDKHKDRDKGKTEDEGEDNRNADKGVDKDEDEDEDQATEDEDKEDAEVAVDAGKFENKHREEHERSWCVPTGSQYRIFAMNRDLTAYEYLRRSVKRELEAAAESDKETSLILYPIPRRPELRRLIIFEPSELVVRSKIRPIKPTNWDRKGIQRSTYSIPYDWLFPFGKKGIGIFENTRNVPLVKRIERAIPKLLKIRILWGFKEPGGNAVIELQRALGCYWMSLVRGTAEHQSISLSGEELQEVEVDFKNLEDDLRELALGRKKNIDAETYISGLGGREFDTRRTKAPRESNEIRGFRKRTSFAREEFEWYKRCIREPIIMPYFRNIKGTCFLWILELIEDALGLASARSSFSSIEDQMN